MNGVGLAVMYQWRHKMDRRKFVAASFGTYMLPKLIKEISANELEQDTRSNQQIIIDEFRYYLEHKFRVYKLNYPNRCYIPEMYGAFADPCVLKIKRWGWYGFVEFTGNDTDQCISTCIDIPRPLLDLDYYAFLKCEDVITIELNKMLPEIFGPSRKPGVRYDKC